MKTVVSITLEKKSLPSSDRFIVHDAEETVPLTGEWYRIGNDDEVIGAPRQILNGLNDRFDFPQVVNDADYNGKTYGLRRRYPSFDSPEYDYVTMPDWCYHLIMDGIKWAANYRLEDGRVIKWVEKKGNRPTGRESINPPIYQEGDGGWFPIIGPKSSNLWAYQEFSGDGKAVTDGRPKEYGLRDPLISGWNEGKPNYGWLCAPFGGAIVCKTQDRGQYLGYRVIDIHGRPWTWDEVLREHLYCWATSISRTRLPNKRYVSDDFPCVSEALKPLGLPRVGTPLPLFGRGEVMWILKSSCKPVVAGQKISAYYPSKE